MSTFSDLYKEVFQLMRDPNKYKFSLTYIKKWINEAEKLFCNRTNYSVNADTSIYTVAGTKEYSQPSGMKAVIRVFYDDVPLSLVHFEDTIEQTPSRGTPGLYYLRSDKIGVYPIPTEVKELQVIYYAIGGNMVSDLDEPIIPEEHQHALVEYACYRCCIEWDDDRVQFFYQNWVNSIQEAKENATERAYPEGFPVVGDENPPAIDPLTHDIEGMRMFR